LSVGFLGRALAAVAGFDSAGAMLPTAPADQVTRWASIPEDCKYYTLQQRAHVPHDAVKRLDRWPHLARGAKYWKISMAKSAGSVSALLRAFGVEFFCTFCHNGNDGGGFDTHTILVKYWQTMCKILEQSDELD
jgi:hypothetical protein